jgi:protein gp37
MTTIEWTRNDDGTAGRTWNPTSGCDRVSPGCDNCYALTMSRRLKAMGQAKYQNDGDPRTSGPGFGFTMHPDTLTAPKHWRKPTRVFVNSMSDLFHAKASRDFLASVFAVMATTPQHTYQILSKRALRMRRILSDPTFPDLVQQAIDAMQDDPDDQPSVGPWPLPNVWLGTSVEDQERAEERCSHLLSTPAAIRFLSCEPLLGPVDISDYLRCPSDWLGHECRPACTLSWVIVGGESGHGARPMQPEWAQRIVDDCRAAGVAAFVKQLGSVLGGKAHHDIATFPAGLQHREYPTAVPA